MQCKMTGGGREKKKTSSEREWMGWRMWLVKESELPKEKGISGWKREGWKKVRQREKEEKGE